MKFLHKILEKQKPMFEKGGKLEKLYYLFEAGETFMFSPATTAGNKGVQIRDAIDLKRMMMTVVISVTANSHGMLKRIRLGRIHVCSAE